MSGFLPTHMEILPPAQRLVWPNLAAAHRLGFVLYGGTPIALRLGHRSSFIFLKKTIDKSADFNEMLVHGNQFRACFHCMGCDPYVV
jgi:hypothetical protein